LFCDSYGGFFNDLLVTTLDGTIATEERDRVSILIGQQLNLEMARLAGKFHNKYRRA